MSHSSDQSPLPRQLRRHIEHKLKKLYHSDNCSICCSPFKHNTRTVGGLDVQGKVVLAGECCRGKVTKTFTEGFYSKREYDFLKPGEPKGSWKSSTQPTSGAKIAEAIGLYQNAITETDKVVDDIARRGGGTPITPQLNLRDSPWKKADAGWFEQNPSRSHLMRLPFPGEYDAEALDAPPGHVLLVLVRQVEPGCRMRPRFYLSNDLLPVPDNEAAAHGLFEVAIGRETVPYDREGLINLIEKYKTQGSGQ